MNAPQRFGHPLPLGVQVREVTSWPTSHPDDPWLQAAAAIQRFVEKMKAIGDYMAEHPLTRFGLISEQAYVPTYYIGKITEGVSFTLVPRATSDDAWSGYNGCSTLSSPEDDDA